MSGIHGTPRLPLDVVHRGRLSALFDGDVPLVVVRGAAGTGKTTAVADWAAGGSRNFGNGIWVTVDAQASGRLSFWSLTLQLLDDAELLPRASILRRSLDSLTSGQLLRRTLVRGFAQLDSDIVIVVDDLSAETAAAIADDVLAVLLACPRLRFVAITGTLTEFDEAKIDQSVSVVRVPPRELLFTGEEIAAILRHANLTASERIVDTVLSVSAGIPMVVRGLIGVVGSKSFAVDESSIAEKIRFAGAEVLKRIWSLLAKDTPDVDALLRLSVAEVLTEELAIELTGFDDASRILTDTEGSGLGWWSLDRSGRVFTISEGFRDGLRSQLEARHPDDVVGLRRIVMRWCAEHHRPLAALTHAVQIGDYDFASTVAVRNYSALIGLNRVQVVQVLDTIPRRTLAREPALAMLLALGLNADADQRLHAQEMMTIALYSVRTMSASSDPVQRAVLYTIESAAERMMGQSKKAMAAAQRVTALLDELTLDQRDELDPFMGTLYSQAGLSFFYGGDWDRCQPLFAAAYAMPRGRNPVAHLHGLALTAGSLALQGDIGDARVILARGDEEEWPPGTKNHYTGAFFQAAAGFVALEDGDYQAALDRVAIMEPTLDTIEHWAVFAHIRSMALLGLGRALEAATTLELSLSRSGRPPLSDFSRVRLDASLGILLIAAGHYRRAESVLKQYTIKEATLQCTRARLHLVLGQASLAVEELQGLEPQGPRWLAETLTLRAAAMLRLGQKDAALDAFERAVVLMVDRGMRSPLALIPASDSEALVRLAREAGRIGGCTDSLDHIIALPSLLPTTLQAVSLSERESVVLSAMRTHVTAASIGEELYVSVNTVKSQIRSIYRKLEVASREEALLKASKLGLFER